MATVLIRTGTLKVGEDIIAGGTFGRIRRIEDFAGRNLTAALPSVPATLFGFNEPPAVNDIVQVVSSKALARLKSQEQGEHSYSKKYVPKKMRTSNNSESSSKPMCKDQSRARANSFRYRE